eukprot:1157079-Pelagomonas_calceolata.AAC.6
MAQPIPLGDTVLPLSHAIVEGEGWAGKIGGTFGVSCKSFPQQSSSKDDRTTCHTQQFDKPLAISPASDPNLAHACAHRGKELARWTCVGGRSALEIYSGASRLWSTHTLLSNDCKQPATSSPVSSNFCRSWPPCPPGHSAPHAPSGPSYLLRRTGAAGESKRCVVWGNSLARPGPKSSPALHRSILSTW